MPLRHIAMYRWAEHVDAEHVQRVREAFDDLAGDLAGVVRGLRHHTHGSDVGVSEGTFDFHVVADFETVADWRTYRDHPAHVLLVEELIRGYAVDQATGQFQIADDPIAPDLPATRMQSLLAEPAERAGDESETEADDELLARARRVASAEMQALLAEPDDPA